MVNRNYDIKKIMILVKGEIKTLDISSYNYNPVTKKWDLIFCHGKTYSYNYNNVKILKNPYSLDPEIYRVGKNEKEFYDVSQILVFDAGSELYLKVIFKNGSIREYERNELNIEKNSLADQASRSVFEYIKEISKFSDIKSEDNGEALLSKRLEKISFVSPASALDLYLHPESFTKGEKHKEELLIFPFGCNKSQHRAVKNAMENQISVIQGPPGTGKTQTILNIIANILMRGKTVQIVSNNNSATENVYEKLASDRYQLDFLVSFLGNFQNKKRFIEEQTGEYPDLLPWIIQDDKGKQLQELANMYTALQKKFNQQERLAMARQEFNQLETELKYFKQYLGETDVNPNEILVKKNLSSQVWMHLWQEIQLMADEEKTIGFFTKLKIYFKFGIKDKKFLQQEMSKLITTFQAEYYYKKQAELEKEIQDIERSLEGSGANLLDDFTNQSMKILKDKIARKYGLLTKRKIFTEEDLFRNSEEILNEYPVILSTTFSSRSSLNPDIIYDYIIMDEASQVDIATGALALSCARNAVIVGDTKQLPNVLTAEMKKTTDKLFEKYNLDDGYRFSNSFLKSILEILPNVAQELLKEHYRCHPKIINFCNQKFYQNQLIIMTEDHGENDVLSVIKTAEGNHARNHFSQRQIDVIKEEVIEKYGLDPNKTGIITPYKNQVAAINQNIENIDAATVHKFQGREKDNIIISTVDDEISDFADNPYLINVAVSRAKKRLIIVTTGNQQTKERNITDLISYIQYNNFEIVNSEIYSVFDYLYSQFTDERMKFLEKHRKISIYDSENLVYALIQEILEERNYTHLNVLCHFPLNMLIKNPKLLNEEECRYAMNPATHLDFLIYNRISKKTVMAVEVDGYSFHHEGTKQYNRDLLKNHILELYGIPLLRLLTTGSEEKEKILKMLDSIVR